MSDDFDFEKQVKEADGQVPKKTLLECLIGSILTEAALRNLEIKPIKKYLGPICEGTIGEIFGPRGIGKTWLRDAISLCLTRKMDLGPLKCENPAGVLIVDGEMGLGLMKERQELSANGPEPIRPLDYLSNEHLYQAGSPTLNLSDKSWREAFIELIKTSGDRWDVIIFDNLSSFLPGVKENDQDAWAPINGFYLQLRWMGKAVSFIHHAGKNGDQRGTSGREDQLDYVLKLTLPPGHDPEEGCRFDATFTKKRSLIGPEAAPFTFEISTLPNGGLIWTVTNQKESRKEMIIALLGNGVTQKSISDMLKVDKAYVSRVRTAAIKQGLLNDKGAEFTTQGHLKYGGIDIERFTG
jgi:putative DNA primase/helicase